MAKMNKKLRNFAKNKKDFVIMRVQDNPDCAISSIVYWMNKNNDLDLMLDISDEMSGDDLYCCFKHFQEMIYQINKVVNFIPSKETFCQFMGWNTTIYSNLLETSHIEPRLDGVIQAIEDYLIDSQLTAGQTGRIKASITQFRTSVSGDHGHSLVTQKEVNDNNRATRRMLNHDQLLEQLSKLKKIETK